MTASRHARAKALFLEAIAHPPGARAAFVAEACGDDAALRRELESLLAFHRDRPPATSSGETSPGSMRVLRHAWLRTSVTGRSQAAHLVTRVARRLQVVSLVCAGSVVVLWMAVNILQGEFADEFAVASRWMPPVSVLAASLLMLMAARRSLAPRVLLRVGLVYQVIVSMALALTQYAGAFRGVPAQMMDSDRVGLSYVATWTFFFTVLVPAHPTEALMALIASNATVPLVYWYEMASGTAPAIGPLLFTNVFVWPYVTCVIGAYIAARIVHQLGVEVRQAQDLGAYRLETLIGRGGMGDVWRASHHTLARPVAIKIIRHDMLGHDPVRAASAIARFETEAQVIASLQSPNTVEIYDVGTSDEGAAFYVMELLDGVDLEVLVRHDGPLPAARVVHILRQVCGSLAEAHHRGLVHRDIKPANIYLCRRGLEHDVVKVLDFGLATAFAGDGATAPGAVIGTPAYMAPETTDVGVRLDGRTDLYALGCVAYWLLTGRVVFPRDTVPELLEAHRSAQPLAPSTIAPSIVPAALDRLVLQCLEKSRDGRPASAAVVAAALEAIAETLPWRPVGERANRTGSRRAPADAPSPEPNSGCGSSSPVHGKSGRPGRPV